MGKHALLRIFIAEDGDELTHAAYPDAFATLCSRPLEGLELVDAQAQRVAPTCETCWTVAERFYRIDGSAPAAWFRRAAA